MDISLHETAVAQETVYEASNMGGMHSHAVFGPKVFGLRILLSILGPRQVESKVSLLWMKSKIFKGCCTNASGE